jgi:hypothetical protein
MVLVLGSSQPISLPGSNLTFTEDCHFLINASNTFAFFYPKPALNVKGCSRIDSINTRPNVVFVNYGERDFRGFPLFLWDLVDSYATHGKVEI